MVLVASPTPTLRRRCSQGLQGFLIHEVERRADLERCIELLRPVVVFLDLGLPGLGGLGGVPDVQRLNPTTKILLLSPSPNERQAVFALLAGARGYCDRNISASLITKATEVVQRGDIWIARSVVPHLLKRLTSVTRDQRRAARAALPTPLDSLNPRERETAQMVGRGAHNKEIASRLSVTEATVKAHLTSVFRKLKVSDRLRLALFVTERGTRSAADGIRPRSIRPKSN